MTDRSKDGLRTAAFWRGKAEEARTLADGMTNPQAKATMKSIAAMYESMARQADERDARPGCRPD